MKLKGGVHKYKIIAVVGPTASGKSHLAIKLAQEFKGEIINADSRQIYKYMNIGTAKDPDDDPNDARYMVNGIVHHLIDFVDPKENFSVAEFQKLAIEKIHEITKRGNIPFLVGGTGLWIDAVCKTNYSFEKTEPNWELRKELESKSTEELFAQLKELDTERAEELNESDRQNPLRLIRAIELNFVSGKSNKGEEEITNDEQQTMPNIKALYLSPKINFPQLEQRICSRVDKMFEMGLIEENKRLLQLGYTYDLPSMSGIGYKEFDGKLLLYDRHSGEDQNQTVVDYKISEKSLNKVTNEIKLRTRQYAKRQITWFKRNKEINHVNLTEARKLVKKFLN